jgi:type II secretory pathway pseudopilin PulG
MSRKDATTAWIIAGVLAVLLLITLVLWINARNDLASVLQNGQQAITAERAQIQADCSGPNMNKDLCSQDLSNLADLLREFSTEVANATTTPPQQ